MLGAATQTSRMGETSKEHSTGAEGETISPKLTPTEQRLLLALRSDLGRPFSRAELCALVMPDAVVLDRTIDVHVRGLRRKLPKSEGTIETVRGAGTDSSRPTEGRPRRVVRIVP
jgi:DNA-binding response OmpR family regulator